MFSTLHYIVTFYTFVTLMKKQSITSLLIILLLYKMKNMILLLMLFANSFLPIFVFAQKTTKEKFWGVENTIDKVIKDHCSNDSIGISILIAKKGTIFYKKAFGKSNIELNTLVSSQTVFEIGSITKQFTALAILKLVQEGKINLKDDLKKYFPNFNTGNYSITIEHLLSHTSGITDDVKEFDDNISQLKNYSKNQLISLFKNISLKFEPGTQFSYSNPSYLLLESIIEQVSNQSFCNYLRTNFFEPLQMKNTFIENSFAIIPNKAEGYERDSTGKILKCRPDYINNNGAGGIATTVDDYYKWHTAVFNYKIVSKELLDKATMPYLLKNGEPVNYGFGFEIHDAFGIPIIHHGGRNFGYNACEIYNPKEDVLVLILNNQSMTDFLSLGTILTHIASGKRYNFKEAKVNEKILDKYTGTYKWNDVTDQKVTITKQNGKLFFKDSYSPQRSLMRFNNDTTFFFYDYGFMMTNTFLQDKTGKIIGFNVKGNGENFNAKKIE